MSAKRQKHYTSIKEIERDIDRATRQRDRWLDYARMKDASAERLFSANEPLCFAEAHRLRDQAAYLRRKADRIDNVRLPKLKRVHASFNTMLLPGVEHDGSAVLEQL